LGVYYFKPSEDAVIMADLAVDLAVDSVAVSEMAAAGLVDLAEAVSVEVVQVVIGNSYTIS
jgi:hypothetical protein